MKHSEFIHKIDGQRIRAAIVAAEAKTTGEIRVFISRGSWPDPAAAAAKHFQALRMNKTRQRNAILIFVAPKSRTFAIFGDTGIHARCGPDFWTLLRDEMTAPLKESRYTDAIVHAIDRAARLLAEHFPASKGDNPNEQADSVVTD